jgi:hypothetical protein
MMNKSNEDGNYSRKWIEIDRALFPDKELMKNLSAPEFKALTLLVNSLINAKKCTVNEGVISVNYNEKVSIHLHIMETISRNLRAVDFNIVPFWTPHLQVTAKCRIDPNRPPLDVCIRPGDEQLPLLDSAFAFVMMAESDFIRMPETLTSAINDLTLSEEALERKLALGRIDGVILQERRRSRRLRDIIREQQELVEQRALLFDFECHQSRIDNLTWRQLLEEHHRDLTHTSLLQEMISEYRSKLIGED